MGVLVGSSTVVVAAALPLGLLQSAVAGKTQLHVALSIMDDLARRYIDNAAMQLIRNPKFFDVVVTGEG